MAIPLVFDTEALARLRAHAEDPAHLRTEQMPPSGDDPAHVVLLFLGWKVVYSLVMGANAYGQRVVQKHLSVSQAVPGRTIHPVALRELATILGMGEWTYAGPLPTDPPSVIHAIELLEIHDAPAPAAPSA